MFEAAAKDPMSFAPGERWQYSDVGYFLLGMVIEKASGQRYRDFLAERFFQPLGMTSTSVLDQWAIVKHRAAGYTLRDGQLVNIRRVTQVALPSHYGVFSTVRDLVQRENALAAGNVVKQSSLEQMWTPVKFNNGSSYPYGFGWFVDERLGHRMITHTGLTGTEYTRFPDDKLTVIVLTNLGRRVGWPRVNAWGLTQAVAGRYVPSLLFSSLKEQSQADQQLTQKLQGMLSSIAKGEGSPSMAPGLSAGLNAERRGVLAAHLKELTSFTFLACEDVNGRPMERNGARISRLCYYRMGTEPETRYYMFWLTSDDLVAEYQSFTE
jgi:CubicO group peptidase (beta-lactamase class C family)